VRLLLAEDSERLQELLAESLKSAGYMLDTAATVAELLSSVAAATYDLLIVDLGLPDGDGLNVIRELRSKGVALPILIITARGSINERITGLDSGADDYLIKPFNHAELLARVRALLRRPSELQGPVLRRGNLEFDQAKDEVRCSGKPIQLRLSERRLLAALMRRSGAVVAKSSIEGITPPWCSRTKTGTLQPSRPRTMTSAASSNAPRLWLRWSGARLDLRGSRSR